MKKIKLGDVAVITSSKRIFEREYVNFGIPFIRGQEISDESIASNKKIFECYISEERYDELKKNYGVPQKNDILITAVGTIGNLYLVKNNQKFYFKDGNILWIKDIEKNVFSKFLSYFMKSPSFNKQIQNSLIGAVQKALTIDMLSKIEIDLPPLEIQKQIGNFLYSLDEKISLNKKINATLEEMAKTIYDYYFVQFDFPDENGKPYKSSGGKMIFSPELQREIPEGWEVKRIKNLLNVVTGKEDANFSVPNGKYKFFTCSNEILNCDIPAFEGSAVLLAGNGDFNVKHYTGKFNAYQRTYVLIPNDKKYYAVLYIAVKKMIQTLIKNSNGSIVKFITKGDVENIFVLDPNNDEFLKKLNNIYELIEKNNLENNLLEKLRDFLLPMLMNGQVKFKD